MVRAELLLRLSRTSNSVGVLVVVIVLAMSVIVTGGWANVDVGLEVVTDGCVVAVFVTRHGCLAQQHTRHQQK